MKPAEVGQAVRLGLVVLVVRGDVLVPVLRALRLPPVPAASGQRARQLAMHLASLAQARQRAALPRQPPGRAVDLVVLLQPPVVRARGPVHQR